MRIYYTGLLLSSLLGVAACGSSEGTGKQAPPAQAPAPRPAYVANPTAEQAQAAALTKDFMTWYTYAYNQAPLGRDFEGLDVSARPLARKAFLDELATGKFIVLKVQEAAGPQAPPRYKLYPLAASQQQIAPVSKQLADMELANYRLEGQPLPAFAFSDLQGKRYTPASTRGKVLVLKTWFIKCKTCVEEFPQVNALVDKYKANPDVEFVSLALDDSAELKQFLASREFKYAVVPESQTYIRDSLQFNAFPTHLVVGKDGKIAKVATTVADLTAALAKQAPLASR